MKKLLVFLSIFAILFTSLNLTPIFKNNAEVVDGTLPDNRYPCNVYTVYSDINVSVVSGTSNIVIDHLSLGSQFYMPYPVSSFTTGVRYTGANPSSYVNVTYTHTEDDALPPNNPPDTFTNIEYLSSDVTSSLTLYFNNFYFSDTLNPLYYGQVSFSNSSDNSWSGTLFIHYSYLDGYGELVDGYSYIDIVNQPVDTPLLFASLLTSAAPTNDIYFVRSMSLEYSTYDNPNSTSDFNFDIMSRRINIVTDDPPVLGNPLFVELQNDFVNQKEVIFTTPFDWLTNALDSFFNLEFFPNFSISSVLGIVFGFAFLVIILKIFFGG